MKRLLKSKIKCENCGAERSSDWTFDFEGLTLRELIGWILDDGRTVCTDCYRKLKTEGKKGKVMILSR